LLDVIDAVTTVWNANQIGVRLSPINSFNDITDSDPNATFGYVARQLNGYGLAYLHVVETDEVGAASAQTFDKRKLRNAFRGTYIVNGGYDKARAAKAIANGDADFVAFGIPFIANPDLVERFALNAPLTEPDQATFYGGDERGYIDYPFLEEAAAAFAA
jgi:N-ethylmaleimide reductase